MKSTANQQPTSSANTKASSTDKDFVAKVSQGGAYEVEASRLAAERGTSTEVKNLAREEIRDHEGVNERLKKIASETGVPITPELNGEFRQRLDKLRGLSGSEFDAAYLADMKQIHDKDEKLFAQEAKDGSDAYKTFAHQTDLIVKRHIDALQTSAH